MCRRPRQTGRLAVQDSSSPNKISTCPKRKKRASERVRGREWESYRKKEKGKKIFRRHEQKDGGLASDEGVTELFSPASRGQATVRSWRRRTDQTGLPQSVHDADNQGWQNVQTGCADGRDRQAGLSCSPFMAQADGSDRLVLRSVRGAGKRHCSQTHSFAHDPRIPAPHRSADADFLSENRILQL